MIDPANEYSDLLRNWCDGLIRYQLDLPGNREFDGGILCPACKMIHGRCADAIYPMMAVYRRTGDEKYLLCAKKLFAWGENLLCDDGSLYNDAQSTWNGITVFSAIALHDALDRHGDLLDAETRSAWEERLSAMGRWLSVNLIPGKKGNINYFCANACAMALLGGYFGNEEYLCLAKALSRMAMDALTENGLLAGEGTGSSAVRSAKGCRAVDIGYNTEESLPSLIRYAYVTGDREAMEVFTNSFRAHLDWMLPDGGWDNSFGTRNFKWTYRGSRTADGCQEALNLLGKTDPVFAEAAYRNLKLYQADTRGGLLFGGRDYPAHGEKPCVHHSFVHAKVLAAALDDGVTSFERTPLPSDRPAGVKYYPELDLWRASAGNWIADVTAYDFAAFRGGHISGGSLSLLWHRKYGPVVAAGMTDYSLREAHNQQLSLKKGEHLSTAPRIEANVNGVRYGQHYDYTAVMSGKNENGVIRIHADAHLADDNQGILEGSACALDYLFDEDSVTVSGSMPVKYEGICYKLPVTANTASVTVTHGQLQGAPVRMFNLNPGFACDEYTVLPDEDGRFTVVIK